MKSKVCCIQILFYIVLLLIIDFDEANTQLVHKNLGDLINYVETLSMDSFANENSQPSDSKPNKAFIVKSSVSDLK